MDEKQPEPAPRVAGEPRCPWGAGGLLPGGHQHPGAVSGALGHAGVHPSHQKSPSQRAIALLTPSDGMERPGEGLP